MSWPSVGAGRSGGFRRTCAPAPASGGSLLHAGDVPRGCRADGRRARQAHRRRPARARSRRSSCRAMRQVGHVGKRRARARAATIRCAPAFAESARSSAGRAAARGRRLPFQRAVPLAHRDIDVAHLHAMPPRVLHELRGRVEAHRLRVEQRRAGRPRARNASSHADT